MNELGRLEELPADSRDALARQNLVPLWPSLRALLPAGEPHPATRATHWSDAELPPLLLRASELAPIEKAERRVLVLANPGHGPERMQASAAIYLGMQLLLPGESAPSHRHTPNAARMVVEGQGAYTTVEGTRCPMSRGDLFLTPTGLWHEHGHDGSEPVVWLDVLDLPLAFYLETSYCVDGPRQVLKPREGNGAYAQNGVVPAPAFERRHDNAYPILRYPWEQTRATLEALAADRSASEVAQVAYINPETGGDSQNILGYYALMLRPGQTLRLPARSPAAVFHLIEGGVDVRVAEQSRFAIDQSTARPCFLLPTNRRFIASWVYMKAAAEAHASTRSLLPKENRPCQTRVCLMSAIS